MFGTKRSCAGIVGQPRVSETAITVRIGRTTVSGVYLRPSLPEEEVRRVLEGVMTSDVVLGDFNFRTGRRSGDGMPRERFQTISSWVQTAGLCHEQPTVCNGPWSGVALKQTLTTDHCFHRRGTDVPRLHLLDNDGLGLRTDHAYTLHFSVVPNHRPDRLATDLPRFRNGRLTRHEVRRRLVLEWTKQAGRLDDLLTQPFLSVERLSDGLVWLYGQVCEVVLGRANGRTCAKPAATEEARRQPRQWLHDRSVHGTHRLVRQGLGDDKSNGPLLPTEVGASALEEARSVLEQRFSAPLRVGGHSIAGSPLSMPGMPVTGAWSRLTKGWSARNSRNKVRIRPAVPTVFICER